MNGHLYFIISSLQILMGNTIRYSVLKRTDLERLFNKGIDDQYFSYILTLQPNLLRSFNLTVNRLTSLSIKRMSRLPWDHLTELYLGGNAIGDNGCKFLVNISVFNLKRLGLEVNNIGSRGISHLSKSQWQQLEILDLSFNVMCMDAVKSISKAIWSISIKFLYCHNNKLWINELTLFLICDFATLKASYIQNNFLGLKKNYLKDLLAKKLPQGFIKYE